MGHPKGKPEKSRPANPWDEIKYFTPKEFTCKCEGFCDHPSVISMNVVSKLDKIREFIGKPITILSGTRCERFNRKFGGKTRSSHVPKDNVSHAVDVRCPDAAFRFAFLTAALPMFNRIGIGKDFIHVDDDPELPSNVIWLYGP
ncbi:MAG: hypothetical protein HY913_18900 [Desulfomonile tiedjei]|nr:hypothetical protein [Desulfomonile tiedjei]